MLEVSGIAIFFILFGSLILLLTLGLPVAFSLGGLACIFALLFWGPVGFFSIVTTAYGETTSFVLVAIPLFIFMAALLQYSGLADDLYGAAYKWFGPVGGGLAMGTVIICAVFAAIAGIATAGIATMGLIALPSMLKRGYNKQIVTGCIMAGGSLGILIPPSITFILYGSQANTSIGQLFMGGMLPGIMLAVFYIIYIGIRCARNPELGPPVPVEERYSWHEKLVSLRGVIAPLITVIIVLGAIYAGVATPTEAAGVGAFVCLVICGIRRQLYLGNIRRIFALTVRTNGMVMWIVIGAIAFSHIVSVSGAGEWLCAGLTALPVSRWVILILMELIFFGLGMFIDPAGIVMITTPIFVPILHTLGFDLVWFGVLFVINMQMAYLTPPFGFALFILKGVSPEGVTMLDIYKSIWPFLIMQFIALIIVMLVPQIALWLPSTMIQ